MMLMSKKMSKSSACVSHSFIRSSQAKNSGQDDQEAAAKAPRLDEGEAEPQPPEGGALHLPAGDADAGRTLSPEVAEAGDQGTLGGDHLGHPDGGQHSLVLQGEEGGAAGHSEPTRRALGRQ